MATKKSAKPCCAPNTQNIGKIESLVSVDERGQMVLSKILRQKADIHPGEKLVVTAWERDGKVCCLTLIKVDEFDMVTRDIMKSVVGSSKGKRR